MEKKKELEAKKKIREIKIKLCEVEKKAGKTEILFTKEDLKKGFDKILRILDKMVKEGIQEYHEKGSKKKGKTKLDYGLRMRFLDDKKN